MNISTEEVRHIAKLARLNLSDEEVQKFTGQLSGILKHAEMLNEIDTEGVEPISQITGLQSMMQDDEEKNCSYSNELLNKTPQSIQDGMIKVKNVF